MDMNEAGNEVTMFSFIKYFLNPRSFKLKVNEVSSDTSFKTEAIPQGNLVSPKFFILKTNISVAQLPNDNILQISIYMEYPQISYRRPNWKIVERKLQDSVTIVEKIV